MRIWKRFGFIQYGVIVTMLIGATLGYNLFKGDRSFYLPGETTLGHHQIEMACDVCHVEAFQSGERMQRTCMDCHAEELELARDTHPESKFTDPRNADLLQSLDATRCVTCHVEHSPEITGNFGVTMPEDFCFHCHQSIAEDRPSHADFAYDSCSDSGCHNYHDNRALYEKFLAKHLDEPALNRNPQLRLPNAMALWLKKNRPATPLTRKNHDGSNIRGTTPDLVTNWENSGHATAQVNCSDCHLENTASSTTPPSAACRQCHERQSESFRHGLHGMRLAVNLPAMQVRQARLVMRKDALHKVLNCTSCHDPHQPDLTSAAVDACLSCHDDEHSRNYKQSAHFKLWQQEQSGTGTPGSGVSCASCHLPRIRKGKLVYVNHNQNLTLEPNSKMLRPVCLNCHGLEYSIAALADRKLIQSNFSVEFITKHPSFDLVRQRLAARKSKKSNASPINPTQ